MIYCIASAMLLAGGIGGAAPDRDTVNPTQEALHTVLERHAAAPAFPELSATNSQTVMATPRGKALYEWAQSFPDEIPQLTYSLYRTFRRTGTRTEFTVPYHARREMLTQAALLAWFEPDARGHMDRVLDLVWTICEESTWVIPPHEGPEWNIDLMNAETAAQLADVMLLVGDRLPDDVVERMRREVDRRVLTNFLGHHDSDVLWFTQGLTNWTGVCSGSIGEAALVFERDLHRQAEILALVIEQLNRYVDKGFEADGGCLEGINYWRYGLLHFVSFAKMLHERTGGEIDLLAHPKMHRIARYPLAMSLGQGQYASFADSGAPVVLAPCITAPLAEKTGVSELLALTGDVDAWRGRLGATLRGLLWWDGSAPQAATLDDVILPDSGIARLVGDADGQPIVVIAKAGTNGEPHNHNDLGSFVVSVGGVTYECDPGSGHYDRAYFGPERYENIFTRSYGHSVPFIGETEQAEGAQYYATLHTSGQKAIEIDLTRAYPLDRLASAVRRLSLNNDGSVVLTDSFAFDDALPVQLSFMTWQDVEIGDNTAHIATPEGALTLHAAGGVFALETFEKECRENRRDGILKRISLNIPAAAHIETHVTMRYSPAHATEARPRPQ